VTKIKNKKLVTLFPYVYKSNKNMATNKPTGDNARKGAVKERSQVFNPKIDSWVKRDTETGKFMDVKTSSNKPFKGVSKEK
jgi:hypothetical protein